MMASLKTPKIILLAVLGLIAGYAVAAEVDTATYGGFTFSNQMPAEQVAVLKSDIKFLYDLPVMKDSNNFQKYTGLKVIDGPNIHNWMLNRIRYLLPESENLDDMSGSVNQSYPYANGGRSSLPEKGAMNRLDGDVVLATNFGGGLYLNGKQSKILSTALVNGRNRPVLSPRIGLVQVSDDYFSPETMPNPEADAAINHLFRISILFHEARHSDGNGVSTGFPHDLCPKNHAYEGQRGCDKFDNASYGMEARFERILSKNCPTCQPADIEVLRMMSLDNFSRLISSPATTAKVSRLQETLSTYKFIVDICKSKEVQDDECAPAKMKETQGHFNEVRNQLELLVRSETGKKVARPVADAKPEGYFEDISLEKSQILMEFAEPPSSQP
jgi:hypothetical protein